MKRQTLTMITLLVLLTLAVSLSHAQGPEPPLLEEEPGAVPGVFTAPPPGMQVAEGVAAQAWAFSGGPNYDSGWVSVAQDQAKTLTHDLGGDTDNYVV